jgi:hypothetical protein
MDTVFALFGAASAQALQRLEEQGLAMTQAGRVDFVCGLDFLVLPMLKSAEFRDSGIHTLLPLGKPMPLYAYLHPRRANLAPVLATALRQMKAEGLIERYRAELLRELGQQ